MATFGQTPCTLQKDGRAYCGGANAHGQVGDGSKTNRDLPTQISLP